MLRKVVGVKVGVVSVGAPPLLLLLVIPGLLPLVLVPLVDGKMSRLDLGVPGVLRSTTGVYQGGDVMDQVLFIFLRTNRLLSSPVAVLWTGLRQDLRDLGGLLHLLQVPASDSHWQPSEDPCRKTPVPVLDCL